MLPGLGELLAALERRAAERGRDRLGPEPERRHRAGARPRRPRPSRGARRDHARSRSRFDRALRPHAPVELGCSFPVGLGVGKRRDRRIRLERRDRPVGPESVGLRRESSRGERRFERAVLAQDRCCLRRPDSPCSRQPIRRVSAEGDEVRHLLGLDAVPLPYLVGADAVELADPALRHQQGHGLAASWNMSRSLVTTRVVPPRLVSATVAVARKSSASYPGSLRGNEPECPAPARGGGRAALGARAGTRARPGSRQGGSCGRSERPACPSPRRSSAAAPLPRARASKFPKPTSMLAGLPAPSRIDFGQGVERPMRERVAVDGHQRAGCHGRLVRPRLSRRLISDQSRSVPSPAASKESRPARSASSIGCPKAHAHGPELREPVHPADRSRHERRVRRERDARRSSMRAGLMLLSQPLAAPRPLGEHRHHASLPARSGRRSRTPRRHPRRGARGTTRAPRAAFEGPAARARTSP